jgi:hypothetical protein
VDWLCVDGVDSASGATGGGDDGLVSVCAWATTGHDTIATADAEARKALIKALSALERFMNDPLRHSAVIGANREFKEKGA